MQLPERVLFIDVETTGLFSSDRIVSLGFVELQTESLSGPLIDLNYGHLIFDPGKKSHPRAEEVHGWNDWVLRHQESFEDHAEALLPTFNQCGLIVAHNAEFDQRFVAREFERAGKPIGDRPFFCTMQRYREKVGGRSGLNAVLAHMGLARAGKTHGPLEDAWMAMQVYLWLHDLPHLDQTQMPVSGPTNLRATPPVPDPLPRRSRKAKKAMADAALADRREAELTAMRAALFRATMATAALMLWVAGADGHVDENEVAALSALVRFEAQRLKITDRDVEQDVIAKLAETIATESMVDAAARVVVRDSNAEGQLPGWLRLVAYADGRGTRTEQIAIARVATAIANARSQLR